MKIALVIESMRKVGLKQSSCLFLARHLLEIGHQVFLLTARGSSLSIEKLPLEVIPTKAWAKSTVLKKLGQAIKRRKAEGVYDAVIGFDPIQNIDFYFATEPKHARNQLSAWLPWNRALLAQEQQLFNCLPRAEIFYLNHAQRSEYIKAYGLLPSDIILPIIVLPEWWQAQQPQYESGVVRRELHLPIECIVAAAFFSLSLPTNIFRSLSAMRSNSNFHLMLICPERVAKYAKVWRRICPRLCIVANGNGLSRQLAAADFLLHVPLRDVTGTEWLKGLFAGIPAVVSDGCGYVAEVGGVGAGLVLSEPITKHRLSAGCEIAKRDRDHMKKRVAQYLSHLSASEHWADLVAKRVKNRPNGRK